MTELLIVYRNVHQDIVLRGSRPEMTALFEAVFAAKSKNQPELKIVGPSGDMVMVSPVDVIHMALVPEITGKIN